MANKLNIVNGIIQDQAIAGYPIGQKIVLGSGKANVRTKLAITPNALCYHNTANTSPTADALNHARYLQNLENADKTYLSVHFFVDDKGIVQTLPINEMAYHAGNSLGNRNSISIEICENGNTAKAEQISKELGASLIMTYPYLAIRKHQDYSGKYCPRVILARGGWPTFVNEIKALTTGQNNVQTPNPVSADGGFLIKVIVSELNIRSTPQVQEGNIVGSIKRDNKNYTIIEVSPNGWGKLKSGAGWINISSKYVSRVGEAVKKVDPPKPADTKVKIIAGALNYRSGAGTQNKIKGQVYKNEIYSISKQNNGWGYITGKGWINISSKYVSKV